MNAQGEHPPPAYGEHEPDSFTLPAVPQHPPQGPPTQNRLPGIKSLALPPASSPSPHVRASVELSPRSLAPSQWGGLPPLAGATFPRVPEGAPRARSDGEVGSPMDSASVGSMRDDPGRRRETSVLSVEDPNVRMAAEALSDLCNPGFARSPMHSTTLPHPSATTTEPEPLLSLFTSNHPWLGGTINGSISAYNATKGYSPRIVQRGAELLERNIGSPVMNTVSSVGRRTGVEQNIRRYLGEAHPRPSDIESGGSEAARKRPRVADAASDAMEIDQAHFSPRTRLNSQSSLAESLPAYDDYRSPNYEETVVAVRDPATGKEVEPRSRPTQNRSWSSQLLMTTSGLGVALSENSLKSLKHCVRFLRIATKHIDSRMAALKLLLDEYESALQSRGSTADDTQARSPDHTGPDSDQEVRRIAENMKTTSKEIWQSISKVALNISNYTGQALPDNASQFVRTQLMSLPQRWNATLTHSASGQQRGEEARGADRMLAFAKEGLEMMGQITTVVDGTVQSAEGWLSRMGKRPQDQEGGSIEGAAAPLGSSEKAGAWDPVAEGQKK